MEENWIPVLTFLLSITARVQQTEGRGSVLEEEFNYSAAKKNNIP